MYGKYGAIGLNYISTVLLLHTLVQLYIAIPYSAFFLLYCIFFKKIA